MTDSDVTNTAETAVPVATTSRIRSIDTLRGVALFGILIMNIIGFGFSGGAYFNPIVDGSTEGLNLLSYIIMDTFFEGSMRTVFSMLFGAGVILFMSKPDKDGTATKNLYFRRTRLLICFGLFDAYVLLWIGDILYAYGVAGLVLFWFKDFSAKRLCLIASVIVLLFASLNFLQSIELAKLSEEVIEANSVPSSELTTQQQSALDQWAQLQSNSFESPEDNAFFAEAISGSYFDAFKAVAVVSFFLQTIGFIFSSFWDAIAMMLLGMALYKWQVFDASRSYQTYSLMTVIGLVVGLSVNYYEVSTFIASGFSTHLNMSSVRPTYDIGRFFTAIGYIGLVMLICKTQLLPRLRSALAAVGQMALSNYLSHSIICGFIFYGAGLGYVNKLERYELYYIVFAIWVFQIITSPLWLKHFRFGPFEWLWRSMTYRAWQPFRLRSKG